MPWDSTRLVVAEVAADGSLGDKRWAPRLEGF